MAGRVWMWKGTVLGGCDVGGRMGDVVDGRVCDSTGAGVFGCGCGGFTIADALTPMSCLATASRVLGCLTSSSTPIYRN
jgi:hypothetical protein